jgi:hypothetical protein
MLRTRGKRKKQKCYASPSCASRKGSIFCFFNLKKTKNAPFASKEEARGGRGKGKNKIFLKIRTRGRRKNKMLPPLALLPLARASLEAGEQGEQEEVSCNAY